MTGHIHVLREGKVRQLRSDGVEAIGRRREVLGLECLLESRFKEINALQEALQLLDGRS